MYSVSTDYKSQINKSFRNPSTLKVNFGIVESNAGPTAVPTTTSEMYYSDVEDITLGINVDLRYATMEHNKFILDGVNRVPQIGVDPYYQGYVSTEISDVTGVYLTPPVITIEFPTLFSFIGLTLRFNRQYNNYASEVRLVAYNGVTNVYDEIHNPTNSQWVLNDKVPGDGIFCDKLELHFLKSFPFGRRAELSYIMFGVVETFDNSTLASSEWDREISLISTRVPKNNFKFTILDKDLEYNPENPTGTWEYLGERQPVWFEYGYDLDDGSTEWVAGPNLFSIGEVKVSNSGRLPSVTFTAQSLLDSLEDTYYRGLYNPLGTTLYDVAVDILDFADLPLLRNGVLPYVIDTALQSVTTIVPVPEMKIKEALQLVANAGRCILTVNRLGQIEIKPFEVVVPDPLTSFKFTYDNIIGSPTLEKGPLLYSVDTFSTTITLADGASVVHESDISLGSATECILKYEPSTNLSIQTTGSLTVIGSPVYYSGSCVVTLNGTGKASVTGTKLIYSKDSVSYIAGQTGYNCPIENVLLDNDVDSLAYAEWVAGVVGLRNEYVISDRGYPEIDPIDTVLANTLFTTDMESIITRSRINFNGALSGQTTYLSKEVVR